MRNIFSKTLTRSIALTIIVVGGVLIGFENDFESARDPEGKVDASSISSAESGGLESPQTSPAKSIDIVAPFFSEPDLATVSQLQNWFDDVFLPEYDGAPSVVRSRFVAIDSENLQQQLTASIQGDQVSDLDGSSSIALALFPDRRYEILTNHRRVGSTGYSNYAASVIGATGPGRQYFQFEFSPDGNVWGRGTTETGTYLIEPTPNPNALLVIEIDESIVSRSIVIN